MPYTATMVMVQPLVRVMISTLRTMQEAITILTLVVARTLVPTVTIISGPETTISVQVS